MIELKDEQSKDVMEEVAKDLETSINKGVLSHFLITEGLRMRRLSLLCVRLSNQSGSVFPR